MPISQLGQINTTALTVPNVYVQIVPPQFLLNGVPSNIGGLVGTAKWGPVNKPVIVGNLVSYAMQFGAPQARQYDMGTYVAIASEIAGAIGVAIACVRVTDGTDVAASVAIQTNCLTVTSKYTGSLGNNINFAISQGSKVNSKQVRISMPGRTPEIFDNILQSVKSVTVGTGGTGYVDTSTVVTFSAPQDTITGRRARGHATVVAGVITAIVIDDPGYGYSTAPTVTITGAGTNAAATATISHWPSIADAINNGINNSRGRSDVVVASAGAGTATPTSAAYALSGGTDGADGVDGEIMLGTDTFPRTGMYALRASLASVATLCDLTDNTTWGTQDSYGQGEGSYMIVAGPASEAIADATSNRNSLGIDSPWTKIMLGDWIYWNDSYNGISQRLVSPAAFAFGKLISLAPQHSTLNKRLPNVVATQKSKTGIPYTDADIQELVLGGVDVVCNPCPGGSYFGHRTGHNSSSNASVHGDNYTRMTDYIAVTLNRGMGIYIGELQSRQDNDPTRRRAKATLDAFLTAMQQQGQIDSFQVDMSKAINPDERIGLGYMQANVKVVYMSVVEFFVINLEGGQTVSIQRTGADFALAA